MIEALISSTRGDWCTPDHIVEWARQTYAIDLDAASSPHNAVCSRRLLDGLSEPWKGRVWCNPPYGRGISAWTRKAKAEVTSGMCPIAVLLVPARTDTLWWSELTAKSPSVHVDVCYITGRLQFKGADHGAPFPSVIVVLVSQPRSKQ